MVVVVLVLVVVLMVLYGRQSNGPKSYLPQKLESFIHLPLENICVLLLPLATETVPAMFRKSSKIPSIFLKKAFF